MGEPEHVRITLGTRIKAVICAICPVCCPAKRWPGSGYARRIRVIIDNCPFCQARIKIKRVKEAAAASQASKAG